MRTIVARGANFHRACASTECVEVLPIGTQFRTASANGNCVEVLPVGAEFRTASADLMHCVSVGVSEPYVIVKDSKEVGVERDGGALHTTLHVPFSDWRDFLCDIKAGLATHLFRGVTVTRITEVVTGKEGSTEEYVFSVEGDEDILTFTPSEWLTFKRGVLNGLFDVWPTPISAG